MVGELIENVTSFEGLFEFPNLITGNWFWTAVLLSLFFVVFFNLQKSGRSIKASVIESLFLLTLLGLLATYVNFINFTVYMAALLLLGFGTTIFFESNAK